MFYLLLFDLQFDYIVNILYPHSSEHEALHALQCDAKGITYQNSLTNASKQRITPSHLIPL
jgi:hypothetical protein